MTTNSENAPENAAEDAVTIGSVLQAARPRLEPVSSSAGLDSQMLLASVLGVERAYLLAHMEQELSLEQQHRFEVFVTRREAGEPVAYILGQRAFYDREFMVSPAVLIPRPETELLLEQALTFIAERERPTVVDVGTGSGVLAVTLAARKPRATVYATDISTSALTIARHNARANEVDKRIAFIEGDLLAPLITRGLKVDVLMANLPYIATGELAGLEVSQYEPRIALDGGVDGLDLIRILLRQAPQVCKPGALVLLEIGHDQGEATLRLTQQVLETSSAEILKDYAGHDRILRAVLVER